MKYSVSGRRNWKNILENTDNAAVLTPSPFYYSDLKLIILNLRLKR